MSAARRLLDWAASRLGYLPRSDGALLILALAEAARALDAAGLLRQRDRSRP